MNANTSSSTKPPAPEGAQASIDKRPNTRHQEQLEDLAALELIFVEISEEQICSAFPHPSPKLLPYFFLTVTRPCTNSCFKRQTASEVSPRGLKHSNNQRHNVPLNSKGLQSYPGCFHSTAADRMLFDRRRGLYDWTGHTSPSPRCPPERGR